MTTDQLTHEQKSASDAVPIFLDDRGWGFGLSVLPSGRYGWEGGLGTSWSSDRGQDTIAILMSQRLASPESPRLDLDFQAAAYQV